MTRRPMTRRPIHLYPMTPRRLKRVLSLLGTILFFLIATRFGLVLQPSQANARDVLNDTFDVVLLPDLQIDAIYGSALDGSAIVFFHTDTGYGRLRMRPQLVSWIADPYDQTTQRRTLMQPGVAHQQERFKLGWREAQLLSGEVKLSGATDLIVALDNGRSLRSPVRDGIFNQLVKAPRKMCVMQIVDANKRVLYHDSLDDDPACDRPVATPES